MKTVALFLSLLAGAAADCYLQYPPGSNNRLDEGGGNRNNNNRLMDTQNNAKGGYGYGGDENNPADPVKYMAGSQLSSLWTSQHSCGSENSECQIVVQYMCNPAAAAGAGVPATGANGAGANGGAAAEGPVRDGTDNGTPDPNNGNADTGLHEPSSFYDACEQRDRNAGLYTADQNMNNNQGAAATRQNPNGNRSGQECPEERDYYPYWHPSPWKDVAVMTNNLGLCGFYQANSQNVVGKNYCTTVTDNNAADCAQNGGQWLEQAAFGIAAPDCVVAPFQRDNHLGNSPSAGGAEVGYNWTIPYGAGTNGADDATNCVARFRYNITTADTRTCEDKQYTTEAACNAAGKLWSALYLDSSYNDLVDNNDDATANIAGKTTPALLGGNPDMDLGGFLADTGGENSLLELAVNTNQFGRTFQDRTHVFEIQSRPAALGTATMVYNLNVKGKRGNIVQTYPATEYDFTPVELNVGANDMVHVQWTGNDNTNNNGNNNGEGTDDEDRHNMVQMANMGLSYGISANQQSMFDLEWEWNPEATASTFGGARDEDEVIKQTSLAKQTGCLTEGQINNDQQRQNCQKLNAAAATVDLGLMKFKPGEYKYMSSRDNNFSNRAMKAKMSVSTNPTVTPNAPVAVSVASVTTDDVNRASVTVSWAAPGSESAAVGTDGLEYWNKEQQRVEVVDYSVQYSTDGGTTWVAAGSQCSGNINSCQIDGLPAGSNLLFRVHAGSTGGWGEASEVFSMRSTESPSSEGCYNMLASQADGSWIAPGTIVAIVFGVLAILLIIAAIVFFMKRRQPPPPPVGFDKAPPPAY